MREGSDLPIVTCPLWAGISPCCRLLCAAAPLFEYNLTKQLNVTLADQRMPETEKPLMDGIPLLMAYQASLVAIETRERFLRSLPVRYWPFVRFEASSR